MIIHTATIPTSDNPAVIRALKQGLKALGCDVYLESVEGEVIDDSKRAITIRPNDQSAYEIVKDTKLK